MHLRPTPNRSIQGRISSPKTTKTSDRLSHRVDYTKTLITISSGVLAAQVALSTYYFGQTLPCLTIPTLIVSIALSLSTLFLCLQGFAGLISQKPRTEIAIEDLTWAYKLCFWAVVLLLITIALASFRTKNDVQQAAENTIKVLQDTKRATPPIRLWAFVTDDRRKVYRMTFVDGAGLEIHCDVGMEKGDLRACPPHEPPTSRAVNLPRLHVFFDPGSSELSSDARETIAEASIKARQQGADRVMVLGHADRAGAEYYNNQLSIERAGTVRRLLLTEGWPAECISAEGRGEADLLVATGDGIALAENRRVEIIFEQSQVVSPPGPQKEARPI